jgi:ABC-type ATPase involved in cell division
MSLVPVLFYSKLPALRKMIRHVFQQHYDLSSEQRLLNVYLPLCRPHIVTECF